MKDCCKLEWESENRKIARKDIFTYISLTKNSSNIVFASVLPMLEKKKLPQNSFSSEISWWGVLSRRGVLPHVTPHWKNVKSCLKNNSPDGRFPNRKSANYLPPYLKVNAKILPRIKITWGHSMSHVGHVEYQSMLLCERGKRNGNIPSVITSILSMLAVDCTHSGWMWVSQFFWGLFCCLLPGPWATVGVPPHEVLTFSWMAAWAGARWGGKSFACSYLSLVFVFPLWLILTLGELGSDPRGPTLLFGMLYDIDMRLILLLLNCAPSSSSDSPHFFLTLWVF